MQYSNEQMDKISCCVVQAATEMNTMLRDAVNASLQSVSIMTKGCGDLFDSLSSLSQKQIDQCVRISQTLTSTTNVNDLVSTQNDLIKNNFDSMMSDITNLSQLSSRIAQQAAEPVTKHVNDSITKLSKTKAA